MEVTKDVMATDPSRLVTGASGWDDHPVGHIMDLHVYPGPSNGGSQTARGDQGRAALVGEMWGQSKAVWSTSVSATVPRSCSASTPMP